MVEPGGIEPATILRKNLIRIGYFGRRKNRARIMPIFHGSTPREIRCHAAMPASRWMSGMNFA